MDDGPDHPPEHVEGAEGTPELPPKHTIFLSHSGAEKQFVAQLCVDMEKAHYYPFFDQRSDSLPIGERFPPLLLDAARKCLVAVVVLSPSFLSSKWPMKELVTFMEASQFAAKSKSPRVKIPSDSTEAKNKTLKFVPLFYKLCPDDLKGDVQVHKFWRALLKREVEKKGGNLPPDGEDFSEDRYAEAEEGLKGFLSKEQYTGALKTVLSTNGLRFDKYGKDEVNFRKAAVNTIIKLVPRQLPVDTSHIKGYPRLCEVIANMFCEKKGRRYLGLYGKGGLGKSTICCEAMFQYFQEHNRGRYYCRVQLTEIDKASDEKGADHERSPDGKKRQDRIKKAIHQLVGMPPKLMSEVMIEEQGRTYLTTQLKHIVQPVFLVVDNATDKSQEEAKWYARLPLPPHSYVLVTSRSSDVLEFVLGGRQYPKPFPTLQKHEAMELFLFHALPSNSPRPMAFTPMMDEEQRILDACLTRCRVDGPYIPRDLRALAVFLGTKGGILSWQAYIEKLESPLDLEYDSLDDTSKLIFLDLALFADKMCFTHMDFHMSDLKWDEHCNFKLVVDFIAMLHGISFQIAEQKVKRLQSSSFLEESKTRISVSKNYLEFARSVINRTDGPEKKWCMMCSPEDDNYYVSGMVRVALQDIRFDRDLYKIHKWRTVRMLCIYKVSNLPVLDLQGLRSLQVLRVRECHDLKEIVCTCNASFSDKHFCFEKRRRCLSELQVVQLEYLGKLKCASFPMHSRKLETLWFYECPDVSSMPDLRLCSKLKRLRLPCGDFKDFQGLKANRGLDELAFHWETDTVRNFTEEMRKSLLHDVMNLTNLTVLDIVDEREVYDWIPAGIHLNLSKLVHVTFLDLSCATTIEEMEGLEQMSQLTSLGLYGCCELRKLPNLSAKFKKLKRLCVGHCHKLDLSDQPGFHEDVEVFHALGEGCAFGEHECLDPLPPLDEDEDEDEDDDEEEEKEKELEVEKGEEVEEGTSGPEYSESEEEEWEYESEEENEPHGPYICKRCNGNLWKEKYMAKDLEEEYSSLPIGKPPIPGHDSVGTSDEKKASSAAHENLAPDGSLNILLLGETGVGKSTFINALCNYLKFPTLNEARKGEMQSLIYSEFITSNDDGDEVRVVVGPPDENEGAGNKGVGGSCTQSCKAYTFPIGERKLIRLVDSPGIGDTRGFDQDMKNIKDILSFISRYEVLNAICILLKPNEERLTVSLRYCIVELLAHLHKDASSNILFCFTNSRSTMFRVGGTKGLLTELLSQSPQTAAVKLEKNTMYHFDSEGFRFLACVKNGLDFSEYETDIFRSSWIRSSDEASRLIQHIASLTPHDIQSTLSLNRVRDMLTTIETPLAAISAAIQNNLDENRKVMKEFLESQGKITENYRNLVIKEEVQETIPLDHRRTICNSSTCKGRVCHARCDPTETVAGGVLGYFTVGEDYIFCEKLSLRRRTCRVCKCPNDRHVRIAHEQRTVVREYEDESVRKVIEKTAADAQKMKEIYAIYEKREKSYEDEMKVVVNAAALFAGFLEQNSIITYHAATQEYLKDQLKKKRSDDHMNTPPGKERIAELEGLLEAYDKQVLSFKSRSTRSGSGSLQMITPEDVKEELEKLFALPRNGECLKILMDNVEREYKWSAIRLDDVAVSMPQIPISKPEAGAKSLLERLASIQISSPRKHRIPAD